MWLNARKVEDETSSVFARKHRNRWGRIVLVRIAVLRQPAQPLPPEHGVLHERLEEAAGVRGELALREEGAVGCRQLAVSCSSTSRASDPPDTGLGATDWSSERVAVAVAARVLGVALPAPARRVLDGG